MQIEYGEVQTGKTILRRVVVTSRCTFVFEETTHRLLQESKLTVLEIGRAK